jgi:carbon monoxide dehydrogenase subunit G
MIVAGNYKFPNPREVVWNALLDPEVLKKCLPGCEKLEPVGQDHYRAHMKVGIASVKGSYQGSVSIQDKVQPEKFRMVVEGKGGPGFLKGEGSIGLAEDGDGTLVTYQGSIQVGGLIASMGQRLMQGATRMILKNFFVALEKELPLLASSGPSS